MNDMMKPFGKILKTDTQATAVALVLALFCICLSCKSISHSNWKDYDKWYVTKIESPAEGIYMIYFKGLHWGGIVFSYENDSLPLVGTKIEPGNEYAILADKIDRDIRMDVNSEEDRQQLFWLIDSLGADPISILYAEHLKIPFSVSFDYDVNEYCSVEFHGVRLWTKEILDSEEDYRFIYKARNLNGLYLLPDSCMAEEK